MDDLDKIVVESLVAVVQKLLNQGEEIPWIDDVSVAKRSIKRWRSFAKRHKNQKPTLDKKTTDLSQGLRIFTSEQEKLYGAPKVDYLLYAQHLARVLEDESFDGETL